MARANPQKKAQEELDVAQRKVTGLKNRIMRLTAETAEAEHDLMLAERVLAHKASSPFLEPPDDDEAQTTIDDLEPTDDVPDAAED